MLEEIRLVCAAVRPKLWTFHNEGLLFSNGYSLNPSNDDFSRSDVAFVGEAFADEYGTGARTNVRMKRVDTPPVL